MIGRSCSASPSPWPNCSPNAAISSGKPNSGACGQTEQTLFVVTPGLIRGIEALARLLVGIVLRGRGAAHIEGPVIAGTVAHETLQDVEEGLVARADQA